VDELLDLILLQSEVLELKANPKGTVLGTVIESHVSRTLGSVATVLVQNGTLNLTDILAVGKAYGKVRSMVDGKGAKVKSAGPSTPVQITGLSDVSNVGDVLKTYPSLDEAKAYATTVVKAERAKKIASSKSLNILGKELNLIIRVDFKGSLEAINEALAKLKNSEVKINILEEAVGEINENDILRASTADAIVIGFHTRMSPQAAKLAQTKAVTVQMYEIIYELVEDLTREVVDKLTPEVLRTDLGRVKVLAIFRTEKESMIVGGQVAEGKIRDGAQFEIKRGDEIVGTGKVLELQQSKIKAREVLQGNDFGASVNPSVKIADGDVLVIFEETVRKKSL
jgi:translation initiation factor IF-2